jgi:hypothetical protein
MIWFALFNLLPMTPLWMAQSLLGGVDGPVQ